MCTPPDESLLNKIKASMIDSFTDFISIADTNRNIVYFNPAAYRMMGYAPGEKPNITTTAELHGGISDEFAKTIIQPSVFAKGSWTGISSIKHKDGSSIAVEMTVFPLYDDNKTEFGTVAVMRDINELTKMNQRLQKSSELFQKVLDSAKIGIVLINMETQTIEMVNEATEELLQMQAADIIGKKCYDILCHTSPSLCPHINEREKKVLLGERYLARKDGSMLPIIKTGTWITIDNTDYLVDTFVDISIQKELEKNLQEAKLVAEAASRSKSEFLSHMSHEMRTPLNAIIGTTQIAERADGIEKLRQCIETIKLSSNHLLDLINDVLDLSKIEEGKLELFVDAFSIQIMMRKIATLVEAKAKEKHLEMALHVDESIPPFLLGDALRLSQVLLNFLSNAVKFTPENGSILTDVRLLDEDGAKARLSFSVKDSGIGITREQIDRLFAPFVQANGMIARKYGGTGLGLVISRRLIQMMGSDIAVESAKGMGSTFSFELVLPVVDESGPKEDEHHWDSMVDLFKGKKALIVDDVEINRVITMELLAETGLAFDEATNGLEAVEKATATLYDIILMDVLMPVMDGYQATRILRKAEKPLRDVPIISMSANVFKEDVERSLQEGMDAHVGKPIELEQLISVMCRFLCTDGSSENNMAKKTASFRSDISQIIFNPKDFNLELALQLNGLNKDALAAQCDLFLRADYYAVLQSAIDNHDISRAENIAQELIQRAHMLGLSNLASYAGNVLDHLKKGNYEYACMYLNDFGKGYQAVCRVLEDLLV